MFPHTLKRILNLCTSGITALCSVFETIIYVNDRSDLVARTFVFCTCYVCLVNTVMFGQVVSSVYLTVNITSVDKDPAKNPQSVV